jgi:hypothetical protein
MAIVSGIREKVHLPIYDCIKVSAEQQLSEIEKSSTLKLFVDVQGKTKLETNLQSASLLPHYNTFEARAMRVVVSDLPPKFSEEVTVQLEDLAVEDENGNPLPAESATLEASLARAMELLELAREEDEGSTTVDAEEEGLEITNPPAGDDPRVAVISVDELEEAIDALNDKAPPREQMRPGNGAGSILSKLIYNTVTTLFVGEKVMVEAPTWLFPGGAGPYSEAGTFATHGEPNPLATFRFAEPIFIDKQQNFRVEIEVPDSDTLKELKKIYGPLFIWVVLDGYMNRGVQ